MNKLLKMKYDYGAIESDGDLWRWKYLRNNKYGFVCVKNLHYMVNDDEREFLIRKPSLQERREIIVNTIIQCNGRTFKIAKLAEILGVSDRTIQKSLRELEKEGLIKIIPHYGSKGQTGNLYRYVGPPCKKYGSGLTIRDLYNQKHNVGFRNWAWKDYEFSHNKVWYDDVYLICKKKFALRVARRKYLEQKNLPLIVPEEVKYLVLRYCYWRGESEHVRESDMFTQDGVKKLELFPLGRTETIQLHGYTFSIEFGGTKENPQVTITDANTCKLLGVFSWFERNIIQSSKWIREDLIEQFFILGDFTTK